APRVAGSRPAPQPSASPIAQAFPIVRRALKILSDREVSPQTGLLKSTLLQLDSTFSERNYGASSFLDFAEKLAKEGVVTLKHAGRSVMVELNPSSADDEAAAARPRAASEPDESVPMQQVQTAARAVQPTQATAEGIARASSILTAAKNARWPMYLRNVKQVLRQAEGGFDERRYGFGGLMDLLKALQRESFVRIERDRRGGLRVFQGPALQRQAHSRVLEGLPQVDPALEALDVFDPEAVEAQPGEPIEIQEPIEAEQPVAEPVPVDTTAELLGRAKARKPRAT